MAIGPQIPQVEPARTVRSQTVAMMDVDSDRAASRRLAEGLKRQIGRARTLPGVAVAARASARPASVDPATIGGMVRRTAAAMQSNIGASRNRADGRGARRHRV